ncbi:oxidoreductase-like protein [Biscogniauxia sp. FL1348]|nr:oxidoreductase-like protein [Biscogniauxia sp. FL1348]
MPLNTRPFLRAARLQPLVRPPRVFPRVSLSTGGKLPGGTPGEAQTPEQAMPIGPYYESILIKPQPVPDVKPEEPPTSSPKSPRTTVKKTPAKKQQQTPKVSSPPSSDKASSSNSTTTTTTSAEPATAQEKARIIFGSRLAGPVERAERLNAIRQRSKLVAGVLVPPRPEEPDNCCMSGCVNCVWDQFRDDMEEWVSATAAAEQALAAAATTATTNATTADAPGGRGARANVPAASLEQDGIDKHWEVDLLKKTDRPKIAKDLWDDDLYRNVPVGIREFMKQEKRLKEKHIKEGTFGA